LGMRVERTFAWEDKFKRLLLRFERIQQRHYGMKLLAYTLINLRAFCGVYNSQPVIKDSREKTALLTQRQAFIPGVNVWAFCLQNSVNLCRRKSKGHQRHEGNFSGLQTFYARLLFRAFLTYPTESIMTRAPYRSTVGVRAEPGCSEQGCSDPKPQACGEFRELSPWAAAPESREGGSR
jgi:hypothetical protein